MSGLATLTTSDGFFVHGGQRKDDETYDRTALENSIAPVEFEAFVQRRKARSTRSNEHSATMIADAYNRVEIDLAELLSEIRKMVRFDIPIRKTLLSLRSPPSLILNLALS